MGEQHQLEMGDDKAANWPEARVCKAPRLPDMTCSQSQMVVVFRQQLARRQASGNSTNVVGRASGWTGGWTND